MDELPARSSSDRNELVKTKLFEIDNNVAAALSYVPICFAGAIFSGVWMATEPKSNKFLRYHAFQSLVLTAACVGLMIVTFVFGLIPFIGIFAWFIHSVISFAFVVGNIYLMYKAYKGQMVTIPYVSMLADQNV